MMRRLSQIWFGALILAFFPSRPALALQPHGPPEGLYVHQMAHLLFAGALLFLLLQMRRQGLIKTAGFRQIVWACWLFILWNALAFTGHWAEVVLSVQDFSGEGLSRCLIMSTISAWIYYVAKLDHLVLVPAFFLLARGLKLLFHRPQEEKE